MKTLLWKDYRQNRKLLAVIGAMELIPYLAAGLDILTRALGIGGPHDRPASVLFAASIQGMIIAVGTAAFVAGNAMAGERADRSAEFAGYLPIDRRKAVASKAALAIGVCLLMCLVNAVVNWAVTVGAILPDARWGHDFLAIAAATAVLAFGAAWLVSSFSQSPAIAAASGLGAVILLAGVLAIIDVSRNTEKGLVRASSFEWYMLLCLAMGTVGLVAGIACYLRRGEA